MCVAMHNVTNNKDDKACGWVVVGLTTTKLSPSCLFVCTVPNWYTALQTYGLSKVCAQASTISLDIWGHRLPWQMLLRYHLIERQS